MGQLGGTVAGHADPEPEAALAHRCARPLEDEGVIHAPARLSLLGRLEELEGGEIHAPLRCGLLRNTPRLSLRDVAAPRVLLRQLETEPVGFTCRSEAHPALFDRALCEAPDRPHVGVVDAPLGQPHEGVPSAGL